MYDLLQTMFYKMCKEFFIYIFYNIQITNLTLTQSLLCTSTNRHFLKSVSSITPKSRGRGYYGGGREGSENDMIGQPMVREALAIDWRIQ